MENDYQKILSTVKDMNLATPSEDTIKALDKQGDDGVIVEISACVIGPILLCYTLWILRRAQEEGLHTLYFLSRDGYVPFLMARRICEQWDIPVECRYFYCSRLTLRSPLYCIDKEYALHKLCFFNINEPARRIFELAGIEDRHYEALATELGVELEERLSGEMMRKLHKKLSGSVLFNSLATAAAKKSLDIVWRYFQQENIGAEDTAIVDSGWLGSMQEGIKKIIDHQTGKSNTIRGFYFGMEAERNQPDNIFEAYYFAPSFHFLRSIPFSVCLFECMCSADHGMTTGYAEWASGRVTPVLRPYIDRWNFALQIETCVTFTEAFLLKNGPKSLEIQRGDKAIERLLRRFMSHPTNEEVRVYGGIPFTDKVLESDVQTLARPLTKAEYRNETLTGKLWNRIKYRDGRKFSLVFWQAGSIRFSGRRPGPLYRVDSWLLGFVQGMKRRNSA